MSENSISKNNDGYKAIGFKHWFAWVLVGIIISGILLYTVLRVFAFNLKSNLPVYNWSASDSFDEEDYPAYTINDDGLFTILHLTDLHILNGVGKLDRQTFALATALIERSQPDLIVVTGDTVFAVDNVTPLKKFIKYMDDLCDINGIKWAAVFGNHDSTGNADKTRLATMYAESKNCLFSIGPTNLNDNGKYGYTLGNYAINLKGADGLTKCSLILMDSNESGTDAEEGGYAPISLATVNWYEWFVKGQTAYNGHIVPSLAFFHIPLCETAEAMANTPLGEDGLNETVCSSDKNTGIFEKMVQQNSTIATFSGHDHQNYFEVTYRGILLTNTISCGYCTYGDTALKGGRVIQLDFSKTNILADTYVLFAADCM